VFQSTRQKFFLAFVVLLLPILACNLGSSHLEKAREAAAEGDTSTAFEEYGLALEDDLEPADHYAALVERGDLHGEQQAWDDALADYEAALAVENDDGSPAGNANTIYSKQVDTLLARAGMSKDEQNWDAALADYEAALALVNQHGSTVGTPAIIYAGRAEIYIDQQNWSAAVDDLDQVLADNPKSYEALARRGYAHLQLRNFEQAIADLKASLQGNVDAASADLDSRRNLVNAYYNLGEAMLDLGQYADATQYYSEALALAEDDEDKAEILAARGFVYSETKDYPNALADLDEALALNPNMALAYAYRSYVYGDQQQYEAAIADATKAVELGTDLSDVRRATIIHARALAYFSTNQYQLAVEDATESIRLAGADSPNTARTYNIRSRAHRLLGNYPQAIKDAGKAIELGATDVVALGNFYRSRALAYYFVDEYAAALSDLEAAMSIDADTPNPSDFDLIGRIYYQQGNYNAALESYQQALALAPDDPWLHNGLGDIYYELEDLESAEAAYREAVNLGPAQAAFHENLGFILRLTDRNEAAIESYTTALSLDGQRPFSWIGRGLAYYNLSQDAQAISDFETALEFELAPDVVEFVEGLLAEIKP